MEHVQLIEKVNIDDGEGVWLTFWSVEEDARLSVEIGKPKASYEIGDVFIIDRDAKSEFELLKAVSEIKVLTNLKLILAPPNRVNRRRSTKPAFGSDQNLNGGGAVRIMTGTDQHVI